MSASPQRRRRQPRLVSAPSPRAQRWQVSARRRTTPGQLALVLRASAKPQRRPGRPPRPGAGVPHRRRPPVRGPVVAHVTVRLLPHVYQLRSARCWQVLRRAFEVARERHGMRLCHYSIQRDHLHLIVEADHRDALSRGMQGLGIRIARGLNGLMDLRGRVLADRYHAHLLSTPLEVRRALLYVLNNVRKHLPATPQLPRTWVDPYSTAACFEGWRGPVEMPRWGPGREPAGLPRAAPRQWLLTHGWRQRGGSLDPSALPAARPR